MVARGTKYDLFCVHRVYDGALPRTPETALRAFYEPLRTLGMNE
jgi:hypothetical protein